MNLSGTGRNFLWSTVPTFVTMFGSVFLLSFSIRRLGRVEYGAAITIGAATSILLLFSGALRYAVVRSGATPGSTATANVLHNGDQAAAIPQPTPCSSSPRPRWSSPAQHSVG